MQLKRDRMNSQERMEALFHYEKPDRVPINMVTVGFSSKNAGHSITSAYDNPEENFQDTLWTGEQYGWDLTPQTCGHTILGAIDFGGKYRLPENEFDGALIIEQFPVNTERDVENLEMPDPKTCGRVEKGLKFAELQDEKGLPVSFVSRSPMSVASNICGLEQFSRWLIKKPELCQRLIRMAFDHIFGVLAYWVEIFGAEKLCVLMSSPCESNQVISPRFFEKFALPYHMEYHKMLRDLDVNRFFFHICGEQNLNLPLLAEACPWGHPSILSFGHEVDLDKAAELFPEDIIFGNIEPGIIQMGTPRQCYELAKTTIGKGKRAPGGFVLSAGCELPVFSPPVNVFAITKAVDEFGWYI